jgi:hypothetical protein
LNSEPSATPWQFVQNEVVGEQVRSAFLIVDVQPGDGSDFSAIGTIHRAGPVPLYSSVAKLQEFGRSGQALLPFGSHIVSAKEPCVIAHAY